MIHKIWEAKNLEKSLAVRFHIPGPLQTFTPCLAEGDGPGFGHLPDFFSLFSPSPWFGDNFRLPDFFGDWPPNPATAGDGTDRATPVRGHAVLRVVVKRPLCPRAETLRLGSESSFCCLNLVMAKM